MNLVQSKQKTKQESIMKMILIQQTQNTGNMKNNRNVLKPPAHLQLLYGFN